ncbi:hypothetical protein Anas_02080, partial [Armadillidium nasatum]
QLGNLETKLTTDIQQILAILIKQQQQQQQIARSRRKSRSPQGVSSTPGLDPWTPRRDDSWGDFRSLTDAPIARLESLDEMDSL